MKTAKAKSIDSEARQRIIATAKRLFYSQGYLATGINQVIAESKVAKNTFYYYFPSKEDLCIAYLRGRHIDWMGWLETSVNKVRKPSEKIIALFDYLEQWMSECRFRGCAFLNIASEIPDIKNRIRAEVVDHKKQLCQMVEKLLTELKESGEQYKTLQVQPSAKTIYVLIEGAIVSSQNFNDTWPIIAAREQVKLMIKGGK